MEAAIVASGGQGRAPGRPAVAIIGAGPAGLMAAEAATGAGARVTVYERMASVGRKFLLAGRGGLNLTHTEDLDPFLSRYGAARTPLEGLIAAFPPAELRAWADALGAETFVGTSGRVFPRAMKASPLLRAWLARLAAQGVIIRTRHTWQGWTETGALRFAAPEGVVEDHPDAVVLALGGASWPKLGADGGWTEILAGAPITPLEPANCGFLVDWSSHLRTRFAGAPLKGIALTAAGAAVRGEATITAYGLEGGAVYAVSAPLRRAIAQGGPTPFVIDLKPDLPLAEVARRLAGKAREKSWPTALRRLGLSPAAIALLREAGPFGDDLSARIKALALVARAISTAGGLGWAGLDARLMLKSRPGVFAAGEMLDWEAPTGGYLLQACFATGRAAAWRRAPMPGPAPGRRSSAARCARGRPR